MQTLVGNDQDIVASFVSWDPLPVTITADGALGSGGDVQLTMTDLAVEFLQTALASPTFPTGALILEFCRRKLNLFKGRWGGKACSEDLPSFGLLDCA
jgi:hypothetical protein